MSDRTILETIEDKIKSDFNLLNHFVKKEDMLNFSVKNEFYSFYPLKDDFIIDIALIGLSIVLFVLYLCNVFTSEKWANLVVSIAAGIFPSVIIAFFYEQTTNRNLIRQQIDD